MVSGFLFVLCRRDNVNKTTVELSKRQYKEIIKTMREGGTGFRPNVRIATALVIEANLGLRIEDILSLKLGDIIADGNRYRFNIVGVEFYSKDLRDKFTAEAQQIVDQLNA